MSLLSVKNLHVSVDGKQILNGIDLEIGDGEVHAVMGPNGSGKSTLSYVLSGREGYEVTKGEILFRGEDVLEMEPHERAAAGIYLAFQYPVEIPGVSNLTFLKTAVNAVRTARGEDELDAINFLKFAREKGEILEMKDELLKRPVNVGFSGGEKKRNEIFQMAMLEPTLAILDETAQIQKPAGVALARRGHASCRPWRGSVTVLSCVGDQVRAGASKFLS